MSRTTLLILLLILVLVGALPPLGLHGYGYMPSGLLLIAVIVLLAMMAGGRL